MLSTFLCRVILLADGASRCKIARQFANNDTLPFLSHNIDCHLWLFSNEMQLGLIFFQKFIHDSGAKK